MAVYIGLDDTDGKNSIMGTGRLARNLAASLAERAKIWGVLRHQLPKMDAIPYTSNNSSACIVLCATEDTLSTQEILEISASHVRAHASDEGDPGVCVLEEGELKDELVDFSVRATGKLMRQKDALDVVPKERLLGLGGSNDGIIGAAAAVGLTQYGWCGRFIEYGPLRTSGHPESIGQIQAMGIRVISVDRDPAVPLPEDLLVGEKWIRPSLWNNEPVLQVVRDVPGSWRTAHYKRPKSGPSLTSALS